MQQEPILRMLCLRHGDTRYTGVFPDLTEHGLAQAVRAANVDVVHWMRKHKVDATALDIISSPAPRAHGTAHTVAQVARLPNPIQLEKRLDQMAWRDPVRCKEALGGFAGKGYIDYETEPAFADETMFETPSEMRVRWFTFFAHHIDRAAKQKVSGYCLLTSHYEVFCHIVAGLFGITASAETALKHVEPIELTIFEMGAEKYYVTGIFRDMNRSAVFDLADLSFAQV